ncbi:MAG: VOC family protein [Pseudomonadota bacterium]
MSEAAGAQGPIPTRGLHHYGVTVRNAARAAEWYARAFGFSEETRWSIPGADITIVLLQADDVRIELFEAARPRENPTLEESVGASLATLGLRHVAFLVDDMDAARAHAAGLGLDILSEPAHAEGGFRYMFLRDPDGNHVELVQPDPLSPGADSRDQAATPSLNPGGAS